MTSGSAQKTARIAVGVVLWALAVVPPYRGWKWPSQIDTRSLLGVLAIAGILGLVAGASRIRSPAGRLAILALGVLLVWPPATGWLVSLVPREVAEPTSGLPGISGCLACDELLRAATSRNGLVVVTNVLVIVAAIPLAIWRRPPSHSPDGASIRTSRLMMRGPVLCVFGGPILGLVGWLSFAPGDIYGTPLFFGVLVAMFGLLAFVGYSAFYCLIGRPGRSAGVAVAYAAAALLAPPLWAAFAPGMWRAW